MTAFYHCKPKVVDGHKFSPMEVGGISLLQLGQHKTERSPRFARDDRLLGRSPRFARDNKGRRWVGVKEHLWEPMWL